jgi:hypothetical protein
MRYLTLCLILCTACMQKTEKTLINNCVNSDFYPEIVTENHLEELYDSSKWLLYQLNILESNIGYMTLKKDSAYTKSTIRLDSCDLVFFDLENESDENRFTFFFEFKGNKVNQNINVHQFHTVIFKDGKLDKFGVGDVAFFQAIPFISKEKALTFHDYLKDNKKSLHEWLLCQAIRKGIIIK